LLPPLAGCLERKESITITNEGRVSIAIAYEGEKVDFEGDDAMPSAAGGWKVERAEKKDGDKDVISLTAQRTFGPHEELPRNYAAVDDPQAKLYLQFPTTLRREVRPDGVYLHFRRVYERRDWAYVQLWLDQIDRNVKKLGEKKAEELTQEERVQIVKAVAGAEALKQVELVERALKESNESLKQDHWLLARQALLEVYEEKTDWDEIGKRLETISADERGPALERESQQILDEAHRGFVRSLREDARYGEDQIARFEAAYERSKKYYQITAQAGGHAFHIQVTMPGTIVAHNSEKSHEDDGTVEWEFDGSAFRDRTFELMATSRLPLDREKRE
jgi:hypothetical protein